MDRRHHRDRKQDCTNMRRVPHRTLSFTAGLFNRPFHSITHNTLTDRFHTQIADPRREISRLYQMLDEGDMSNVSADGEMCLVRSKLMTPLYPILLTLYPDTDRVPH